MAAALRRLKAPPVPLVASVRAGRWLARWAAGALFVLPLLAALPLALQGAASAAAWHDLWADPQLPGALRLSLTSALVSTGAALVLTLWITTALHGSAAWARLAQRLPALLAVPHAAFAIGLAWLVAPSGAIARLLAPLLGWTAPPPWTTVQDPQGLLLMAVLLCKELPFLLWNVAALLARPEVAQQVQRQVMLGRSLGYSRSALWWKVLWPVWLPRLAWPLLAVAAYSLTVVDLALIVGPGSPPTLAVLSFADLTSADPLRQQRGAVAALLLALVLALIVLAAGLLWRALQPAWRVLASNGRRSGAAGRPTVPARIVGQALVGLYAVVGAALLALSVAGVWRFPALWPQVLTGRAWQQVAASAGTVGFSVLLAAAAAGLALLLCVAWLEATPPRWDAWATPLVLAPLVLPPLLLMGGLYREALLLALDGTVPGLLWGHLIVVLPYVFIALQPAWRSFDPRYETVAISLGRARVVFWWRVKWPLLAAPLASALAIGFAVGFAQYLVTQFIGAGRLSTVTTEAVTLASGGQRTLAAAFALLQAGLPLLAFAGAAVVGRRALRLSTDLPG